MLDRWKYYCNSYRIVQAKNLGPSQWSSKKILKFAVSVERSMATTKADRRANGRDAKRSKIATSNISAAGGNSSTMDSSGGDNSAQMEPNVSMIVSVVSDGGDRSNEVNKKLDFSVEKSQYVFFDKNIMLRGYSYALCGSQKFGYHNEWRDMCSRIREVMISKDVSMNLHFVVIITNYESLMPFFAFQQCEEYDRCKQHGQQQVKYQLIVCNV